MCSASRQNFETEAKILVSMRLSQLLMGIFWFILVVKTADARLVAHACNPVIPAFGTLLGRRITVELEVSLGYIA